MSPKVVLAALSLFNAQTMSTQRIHLMSSAQRSRVASDAADALGRLSETETQDQASVFVGFDGFVDTICRVARVRSGPNAHNADQMTSMRELAQRISDAAGKSANIELLVNRVKIGGNGPILALALATLGARVRCMGAVADPVDEQSVDPMFGDLAKRCAHVVPLAPPGRTDALEFGDGKVMLGKIATLAAITWDRVVDAVGGPGALRAMLAQSSVIVTANWTMLPGMNEIWRNLASDILPALPQSRQRCVFVDLADPARRSDDAVLGALETLGDLNAQAPVTLGLNAAEALRMGELTHAAFPPFDNDSDGEADLAFVHMAATALGDALPVSEVVVHTRSAVAGCSVTEDCAMRTAFTPRPEISTGAGDHFNAGFCLGLALGFPMAQRLAIGVGVSGLYVRKGEPPDRQALDAFLRTMPGQ